MTGGQIFFPRRVSEELCYCLSFAPGPFRRLGGEAGRKSGRARRWEVKIVNLNHEKR